MPSKKNPKYLQIILALSLILGTPAVMMAYSSQAKVSHASTRMEQVGSREEAEASEAGEIRETVEAKDLEASEAREQADVKESGEQAEADEDREGPEAEENENHSSRIPASLWRVSENGEDVYDSAKAKNWTQAQKQLSDLQQAQAKLSTEVQASKPEIAGVDTSVTALAQAISEKNNLKAMDAANQITLHAIKLTAQVDSSQPVELSMLDYLGRELELGAFRQDQSRIQKATQQISHTWKTLKPNVEAHGGAAQARKFDALVQNITTAKSMQDYRRLASDELAEVDHLEKVFEK